MDQITLSTRAEPLERALQAGNSQADTFSSLDLAPSLPTNDGAYLSGNHSLIIPDRLFFMPLAQGAPGKSFSMRVYGWRSLFLPDGISAQNVSIPHLLAEFNCSTCNRGGFSASNQDPSNRTIANDEYFCNKIELVQGNLGPRGFICSFPDTDLIASACLDLMGCTMFYFDFQRTDQQIAMNCLFARM